MIVARVGDTDDASCNTGGCADGDYYMNFNVADQPPSADDPVDQLQDLLDNWRISLLGIADGIESQVVFTPVADGFDLRVNLRDWTGSPLTTGGANVMAVHAADSDGLSTIGVTQDLGDGRYSIPLSLVGGMAGIDRFVISIDNGGRTVVIAPNLAVLVINPDLVFTNGFE